MISKQQLKEGLAFKFNGSMYSLKSVYGSDDSYYIANSTGYVANIDKIGTKSLTAFTYVMNKLVKLKIDFSECEPVVKYFK